MRKRYFVLVAAIVISMAFRSDNEIADPSSYLDDINCGYENTLSAPQYLDLTKVIKPGKHKITVLVDNAKLPPVGPSHAVDERTQTNWNGIVGRIELQVTDPVWIEEVQVYPDIKNNRVKIRVNIGNTTNKEAKGELLVSAQSWNTKNPLKFKGQKEKLYHVYLQMKWD
ncbi:unnamed protein product [marine sediment metagenome]|uniref:Uncharacterized protein n=1 Tax=marine sediment metagenome TaxID=412755 RepID=X1S3P2_9ZZZZ